METKICPKCQKKMIKRSTGIVLSSYPQQYPMMWWCGCGHQEPAETIQGKTDEQVSREEWERING